MKALTPVTVPPVAEAKRKASEIGLPSILNPLTVTSESKIREVVPPPVTVKLRGTSGFVIPEVTVTGAVPAAVAARTAVVEAVAIFFEVSVYPKVVEYIFLKLTVPKVALRAHG